MGLTMHNGIDHHMGPGTSRWRAPGGPHITKATVAIIQRILLGMGHRPSLMVVLDTNKLLT